MADVHSPLTNPHKRIQVATSEETGQPLSAVSVNTESGENMEAYPALQESRKPLQAILRTSLDAGYRRNLRTERYDYMSPVIEQITGYSAEEMCALSLDDMLARIHPEDRPKVMCEAERILAGGRAIIEYRILHKDGEYRWVADHSDVLMGQDGRTLYRVGFLRDATKRVLLEEACCEGAAVDWGVPASNPAAPGKDRISSRATGWDIRQTAWVSAIAGVILLVGIVMMLYRAHPGQQVTSGTPAVSDTARQLSAENASLRVANGDLQKKLDTLTRQRNRLQGKAAKLEKQVARFATRTVPRQRPMIAGQPLGHVAKAPVSPSRDSILPTKIQRPASLVFSSPSPGAHALSTAQGQSVVTLASVRPRQRSQATRQPIAPDPPSSR